MEIIQKKNRYPGAGWPGRKNIYALTNRACGLFVWASIVCNFIDAHEPRKRLDIILQGDKAPTAEGELDRLYRTALDISGAWDDKYSVADFTVIIGMVPFLRNPLASTAIDNLLANPDGRPSIQTINKLSCIMSSKPTVRFIHPSVADFLMDRSRCDRDIWFFIPTAHERNLAILCLRRLNQVLYICMSQTKLIVDNGNPTIPKDVAYACVFWVDHVYTIKDDLPPIEELVKSFIDQHAFHWFETMRLLKRSSLIVTLLDQWLQNNHSLSLLKLIDIGGDSLRSMKHTSRNPLWKLTFKNYTENFWL